MTCLVITAGYILDREMNIIALVAVLLHADDRVEVSYGKLKIQSHHTDWMTTI